MEVNPQPAPDGQQRKAGGRRPGSGRPRGSRNRTRAEIEQLRDGVHRLKWIQTTRIAPKGRGGPRPGSGRKPKKLPIIAPWRLPVCLSRTELLGLLRQAQARRQRDWLMILVAFWHRLSAAEVTGFTKEAVLDGSITIQRVKSHKVTTERLVRHTNRLLDEREALVDFVAKVPPDQPVFNIHRMTFWRIMKRYCQSAGIPAHKANPRALKYSIAVQNLASTNVEEAQAAITAAQAEVEAAKAEVEAANVKLAEAEAAGAEAKRRELLKGKALWMQVAGNFLLDNPSAESPEVFAYLDKMRVPRRDGKLWATVSNKPSVKNDLSDLRRLLGIQGRKFGRKL